MHAGSDLARARGICLAAYVVALVAAVVTAWIAERWLSSPYWRVLVADVVATLVVFGFSVKYDNSSLYDPYWSVAPMVATLHFSLASSWSWRGLLVTLLVQLWGARLTYNWLRQWRGLGHEDWRYVAFRRSHPGSYWLISLFGFHLFPTVQVLLGLASVYAAVAFVQRPLGGLDVVAMAVAASGILIEAVADRQLHDFVRQRADEGRILDRGLWAYSRHPNYFGELSFWWGLALCGYAATGAWWCFVGAVSITSMFLFVSLPLIEKRMLRKRPHYRQHMERVSRLVPWPPKSVAGAR